MGCNCSKRKWWYGAYDPTGALVERFNSIMEAKRKANELGGSWRRLNVVEANA